MTLRKVPRTHFVYEYSYPSEMPDLAGVVFYVGKGTTLNRMDAHLTEAAGECDCAKCEAIRSVWALGLVVVRQIVFESMDERQVLMVEKQKIAQHLSPHLVNVQHNSHRQPRKQSYSDASKGRYDWVGPDQFVISLAGEERVYSLADIDPEIIELAECFVSGS